MYTVGKVLRRFVSGHISVVQVVNHFGDAADIESYARNAARHCFHNHVGKIFFQRRNDKQVYGIIYIDHFVLILDVRQRVDMERNLFLQLLGLVAEYDDSQRLFPFRMFLSQQFAGFD